MVLGGRRALVFTPAGQRVRTAIVLPGLDRPVDVTAHPAAAVAVLHEAADQAGIARQHAEDHAREVVTGAAAAAGAWTGDRCGSEPLPLTAVLGGTGLPLLAAAYDAGARALGEVPRWAVPVLASATARDGARTAFGADATRVVVAALAAGLLPDGDGEPQLWKLALGRIGRRVLDPDRLARVLAAPGPNRVLDDLPERERIDLGSTLALRWGAHRTTRVLVDASAQADGPHLLDQALRFGVDLGDHGPTSMPNRLVDLHRAYRLRTATDSAPRPQPRPRPRVAPPAPARQAPQAPRDRRADVYRPPATEGRSFEAVRADLPLPVPSWARQIDGHGFGDLRFVLPRTIGDLTRWSAALTNCLDTYGPAAVSGRSLIVGIERDRDLRYALELTQQRTIRQFVGPANRPPDPAHRGRAVRVLLDLGVLDPAHRDNAIWLTGDPEMVPVA